MLHAMVRALHCCLEKVPLIPNVKSLFLLKQTLYGARHVAAEAPCVNGSVEYRISKFCLVSGGWCWTPLPFRDSPDILY